ncbi:PPA1309 family protein [Alteromonas gracilis]
MSDLLRSVVRELEVESARGGWDQAPRLFALVSTEELIAAQPQLADTLTGGGYTPVEQDPPGDDLESVLAQIVWPEQVAGTAVIVERYVLPAGDDDEVPSDVEAATAYVADHPDKQEVRIVAAVDRSGETFCALRLRAHDDPLQVLTGPDLVPALLELLAHTLSDDEPIDRENPKP